LGTWLKWLESFERDLLQTLDSSDLPRNRLTIAIGGFSGVGKDTLAISLQRLFRERFDKNLSIVVAGETLRQLARRNGFRESDLDLYMEKITNEKSAEDLDRRIEQETLKKALTGAGDIFVGRMAPFSIGDWAFTIWLEAERKAIAWRVVNDPNRAEYGMDEKEIVRKLQHRDETDHARYEAVYSIRISELVPKVDLLLDTTQIDITQASELAFSNAIKRFQELNLL
jgi:cytidylate kinase